MRLTEQQRQPKNRLDQINGYPGKKEAFKQIPHLGTLLHTAEEFALDVFPQFAHEVPGLNPQNPYLDTVLRLGDYQNVSPLSEEYGQLMHARAIRQKIARAVVRETINSPESNVQLSPEQRILLTYGLQIQDVVDDLHLLWHGEVVRGENAEEIKSRMQDPVFAEKVLGPHGDFLYGVVRKNDESEYSYVTYKKMYPDQIGQISSLIDGMTAELQPLADAGSAEAHASISVHKKWQTLLNLDGTAEERILQRQEDAARDLDCAFMLDADALNPEIHSQILYPMETYVAGKYVEWQYDILLQQHEYNAVNNLADETKQEMIHVLESDPDFEHLTTLQNSIRILKPTHAAVYLRFPSGTSALSFRSGASNVPNRPEVRLSPRPAPNEDLAIGSKINFDYVTFELRAQKAQELVQNVLPPNTVAKLSSQYGNLQDPEVLRTLIGRFIAGHEDAHNILERSDTLQVLGIQNHIDLDEIKADLAGVITCLTPGFLGRREKQQLIYSLFGEELRGLSRWSERDLDRSHLNGNIVNIQLLMDSGILQHIDGTWNLDLSSDEKVALLRQKTKEVFLDFAQIYESENSQDAHRRATTFKAKYVEVPSRNMLQLLLDSKIISHDEYERELQANYSEDLRTRRTQRLAA